MKQKYIIYSMQRTGHHAVLFWLINNCGGYNKNIKTYMYWDDIKKLYYYNDCNHMKYNIVTDYNYLFMSYEDTYNQIIHKSKEDNKIIIILRDFVNMIASRYKKFGDKLGFNRYYLQNINDIIQLWKKQANEIINNDNIIPILYNKWLFDKKYRDEICQQLMIENINDKIDHVPEMGQGSSFCGIKIEEDKNSYIKRYENIKLSNEIKEKIKIDKELIELNKILFDIDITKIL